MYFDQQSRHDFSALCKQLQLLYITRHELNYILLFPFATTKLHMQHITIIGLLLLLNEYKHGLARTSLIKVSVMASEGMFVNII